MKPHKHAELIHKWADGAEIQIDIEGDWLDVYGPSWDPEKEFRLKPQPKPDRTYRGCIYWLIDERVPAIDFLCVPDAVNVSITFDGETNQLKAVELIAR